MKKQFIIIALLTVLSGLSGCNSKATDKTSQTQTNAQEMAITVETLKQILETLQPA